MTVGRVKRVKKHLIKVIVRRLPREMTEEELLEQVNPLPATLEQHWFCKADMELMPFAFTHAYFVFSDLMEAIAFCERFNGYVFVDKQGNESAAIAEQALCQVIAHRKSAKEKDSRVGTIENEPEYLKFLENYNSYLNKKQVNFDQIVKELEEKHKPSYFVKPTPLTEFVAKQSKNKEKKRVARLEKFGRPDRVERIPEVLLRDRNVRASAVRSNKPHQEQDQQPSTAANPTHEVKKAVRRGGRGGGEYNNNDTPDATRQKMEKEEKRRERRRAVRSEKYANLERGGGATEDNEKRANVKVIKPTAILKKHPSQDAPSDTPVAPHQTVKMERQEPLNTSRPAANNENKEKKEKPQSRLATEKRADGGGGENAEAQGTRRNKKPERALYQPGRHHRGGGGKDKEKGYKTGEQRAEVPPTAPINN